MQLCNKKGFFFLNCKSPLAPLCKSGEPDELYSEKVPPFGKGRLGGILNVMS
jgi:hypothetical protein